MRFARFPESKSWKLATTVSTAWAISKRRPGGGPGMRTAVSETHRVHAVERIARDVVVRVRPILQAQRIALKIAANARVVVPEVVVKLFPTRIVYRDGGVQTIAAAAITRRSATSTSTDRPYLRPRFRSASSNRGQPKMIRHGRDRSRSPRNNRITANNTTPTARPAANPQCSSNIDVVTWHKGSCTRGRTSCTACTRSGRLRTRDQHRCCRRFRRSRLGR